MIPDVSFQAVHMEKGRTIGCTKVAEWCVLAIETSPRRLGDPFRYRRLRHSSLSAVLGPLSRARAGPRCVVDLLLGFAAASGLCVLCDSVFQSPFPEVLAISTYARRSRLLPALTDTTLRLTNA